MHALPCCRSFEEGDRFWSMDGLALKRDACSSLPLRSTDPPPCPIGHPGDSDIRSDSPSAPTLSCGGAGCAGTPCQPGESHGVSVPSGGGERAKRRARSVPCHWSSQQSREATTARQQACTYRASRAHKWQLCVAMLLRLSKWTCWSGGPLIPDARSPAPLQAQACDHAGGGARGHPAAGTAARSARRLHRQHRELAAQRVWRRRQPFSNSTCVQCLQSWCSSSVVCGPRPQRHPSTVLRSTICCRCVHTVLLDQAASARLTADTVPVQRAQPP